MILLIAFGDKEQKKASSLIDSLQLRTFFLYLHKIWFLKILH